MSTDAMDDHYITDVTHSVIIATNQTDALSTDVPIIERYWSPLLSISFAVILVAIWILSFFGNLLVLAVIARYKGMRTRTNLFIANLALVDFLTAALCMPFSLTTVIMGEWVFNDTLCQINGFLMPTVFITSVHTLMYISLHKHFTITNPFKTVLTKRIVLVLIAAAWIVALILAIVDVYGLNRVEFKDYTTQCGPKYPNEVAGYLHNGIMTLTTYIIPFCVMTFSYSRMFREIIAYSRRLEQHTSVERSSILNTQKKAACTLFIVVVCFLLCWTPYLVYATYGSAIEDKSLIPKWLNPVCYWFGYLNSAVNPIIYGLRNKSFSTGYRSIICSCFGPVATPGTDDGSKIFNRKRSSVTSPDVGAVNQTANQQTNRKTSKRLSDTSLPIVIRKNGKIIRIEDPATMKRKRSSGIIEAIPEVDADQNTNRDEVFDVERRHHHDNFISNEKNHQEVIIDDVKVEKGCDEFMTNTPKLSTELPVCLDSGNDSDMSESPRNSTNKKLVEQSIPVKGPARSDRRRKYSFFRSLSGRKAKPLCRTLSLEELPNSEFRTMSRIKLDPIRVTNPIDSASLPSPENVDCGVMNVSEK